MKWRLIAAIIALVIPAVAKADYWTPAADITCSRQGNIALIRFGGKWTYGKVSFRKLPRRVDDGLSAAKPSNRSDCILPNGWRLRVRVGQKQAFAYGAGGGDPPAFFSLWINKRRVFSAKEWKPGYDAEGPSVTALVIRPNKLSWCRARDETSAQTCTNQPFVLSRFRPDMVEYPSSGRKWKIGTLLATRIGAAEGFCARYIHRMRAKMLDTVAFDFALSGNSEAPFAAVLPFRTMPGTDIAQADVEIAPKVWKRLLVKRGYSHFFDGDVVFILPPATDTRSFLPKMEFVDGSPDEFPFMGPRSWTRLIGGSDSIYPKISPRYVHFVPERIDGRLYFLASPTNASVRPTAQLVGLKTGGGIQIMCQIQRVEPHF